MALAVSKLLTIHAFAVSEQKGSAQLKTDNNDMSPVGGLSRRMGEHAGKRFCTRLCRYQIPRCDEWSTRDGNRGHPRLWTGSQNAAVVWYGAIATPPFRRLNLLGTLVWGHHMTFTEEDVQ
ncbi:hypothetical protein PIIN_06195 [Serendipita indica DSM 11827]|uniref:Uncharacterized protein n=1 Tax=Serendipita indica (strain DSM 11827) TaxID=1109443 RepID=G4TLR6_SERID|nr:hypothetical protein PIIN_06195 [Serendipita indica DSM 11827]